MDFVKMLTNELTIWGAISILSMLAVEGVKKCDTEGKFNPTNVALIINTILIIGYKCYCVFVNKTPVDALFIAGCVAQIYLIFVITTNGYDKIKEAFENFKTMYEQLVKKD